jgi:hypothetical protein
MQEPDLYHDRIFKCMPRCEKYINVFRDYILKMRIAGAINDLHVIL